MERTVLVFSKIERARKHIADLYRALDDFWNTSPYSTRFENDRELGKRTYYLVEAKSIPSEIPMIVGDVLHNTRSALDHLVYQLVIANGNKPTGFTGFPIASTANEYMSSNFRRKVEGIGKAAIEAIDRLEPYKSGRGDPLWRLHKLNNVDKHRLLITACTTNTARSMTPTEKTDFSRQHSEKYSQLPVIPNILQSVPRVALKGGDEIYTVTYPEMEDDMGFQFDIAFHEPEIMDCQPLTEFLIYTVDFVSKIILTFASTLQ